MRRSDFRARDEVLLTADDHDALSLYATGLEHYGFTVFSTPNPAHATAFVQRGRPPNIVVIVASLRDRDAWTTLDPLVNSAVDAQVPVVIVTASVRADGRHRRAALNRGCAAFVGQPCPPDELSFVLHRVLGGEAQIVSPPLWS